MHEAKDHGTTFVPGAITARGPVSAITVYAHMRSGPHAVLEHPLDLAVVVELCFQLAEKARLAADEAPQPVTPQSILERLREMGVRSGNGSRLVGRDAVYESFARLRAKGYLRRITHRAENKVAGVSYEFYEFPAWNPEPPVPESSQVGATSGNAGSGNAGSSAGERTKSSSPQVRATSGNAGSGNAGSRSANSVSPQVRATSGNAGSPPHPPGGGTTPPPNPLTHTDGARPHPSQTEEGGVFDEKDLQAAAAFLQQLPDPWVIGEKDATDMAPELLEQMRLKQWPSIHTANRRQLANCLATNSGGAKNLPSILRRRRIPNLPAYSRVVARAATRTAPARQTAVPAVVECDKGCDRGYLELEDRVAPCECLPQRHAAAI